MLTTIATFLIKRGVPLKLARPLIYIAFAVLVFGAGFLVKCQFDARKAAQARVDAKAAEAYATSAGEAVNAVAAAAGREADLDKLADKAMKELDNAQDPEAARAAVDNALCQLQLYRDRPECKVQ